MPDAPALRLSTRDWYVHAFAAGHLELTVVEALCGEVFLITELDQVVDVVPTHIPCVLRFADVARRHVEALRAIGGLVGKS